MSNKEAIRLIRNLPTMCEFTDAYGDPIDSDTYYEAVDMAISVLEKQIPKKPNMIQGRLNENIWNLHCPSCENWIGIRNSMLKRGDIHNISNGHICPHCGQVIDWGNE